jgi:hypothetical protein
MVVPVLVWDVVGKEGVAWTGEIVQAVKNPMNRMIINHCMAHFPWTSMLSCFYYPSKL